MNKNIEKYSDNYINYKIGKNEILLPIKHPLPTYRKQHRLYDKFLPVLCSVISENGIIIDVGANVGDTVAAIAQTCGNQIIAIEGYEPYFDILKMNIEKLGIGDRVEIVHAIVGTQVGSLVAHNGTASLSPDGDQHPYRLDEILIGKDNEIILIKVDTDGYDYDVLLSGLITIENSKPILFWEGGTSDVGKFLSLYSELQMLGYNKYWVFDNFGNILLSECELQQVKDFDEYIYNIYKYECTKTFSYIDILSVPDYRIDTARVAISLYKQNVIRRLAEDD